MKKFIILALLLAPIGAMAQEDFVRLPSDSSGKRLRMRTSTQNALTVYSQGFFLDDGSGSGPLGLVGSPLFMTFTNSAIAATQSGTWNINNISGTITLPTGAATETTLAGIKAGTDKIPSSPATDRTTAASPFSVRLSDGSAFFDPRSIRALTSSDVVTVANTAFIANAGTNLNTSALALESGGNLATIAGKDFATQTTLALIKAKTDNIPADPSREGGVLAKETGGNLATIAANTTTGNASAASIDSKTPVLINGGSPVTIVNIQQVVTPPVLTAQQLSNSLLFRAAMKQFCSTNLCPTFGR